MLFLEDQYYQSLKRWGIAIENLIKKVNLQAITVYNPSFSLMITIFIIETKFKVKKCL